MIGAFLAFGTPSSLAIPGGALYRLMWLWLPTVRVQSRISSCGAPMSETDVLCQRGGDTRPL